MEPALSQWGGSHDMKGPIEWYALFLQVMTGVERLMSGDAEHAVDDLTDEEECLALLISSRTLGGVLRRQRGAARGGMGHG